jgi:hypothetical protein
MQNFNVNIMPPQNLHVKLTLSGPFEAENDLSNFNALYLFLATYVGLLHNHSATQVSQWVTNCLKAVANFQVT